MSGAGKANLDLAGILGAYRTIAKPFTPADILALVNEMLEPPPAMTPKAK